MPHFVEFVCQIKDPIPLDNLLTEVLGFSKVPSDVTQSVHTIMQTYNLGTDQAYHNQIYTLLEGHLDLRTLLEFHPYFPGMHHTNPQAEPLFLENTSHVELLPLSSAYICAKYPAFSFGQTIPLENFVNDFAFLQHRRNPIDGIYDIHPVKKSSGFALMVEMDGNRMEQLDLVKEILEDSLQLYNDMLLDIPSEDRENHLKKGFDYIKLSNTTKTNKKASGQRVKI